MVEYSIQNQLESHLVSLDGKVFKAFVIPEPSVNVVIIHRVVAVRRAFKKRAYVKGVYSKFL